MLFTAKEEELLNLKKSSRINKYHEQEVKLKATLDELITCKDENSKLLKLYSE